MSKVLVVDDDPVVRRVVVSGLKGYHGIDVVAAATGEAGLALLESEAPSVAILDIYIGDQNGLELFRQIKALDPKIPILFITGQTSSEVAIQAIHSGAFDYLPKPFTIERLRSLTLSAIQTRTLMDEPVAIRIGGEDPADVDSSEQFVGHSAAMIEVYKAIGRVASSSLSVLIQGESGVGKELVARALVQHSDRASKPFAAVNCAAIPDQLLESELFGHEKGAYTGAEQRRIGRFELCNGGTILLDEIGDMSPIIQGKVLRLLQEQKFERLGGNETITTNVRIVAATNRPLEHMVELGTFRQDLLYRLNGFCIVVPPLRERREDIPLLVNYFLRRAKLEMDRPELTGISPAALEILLKYDWPGNVRQLQSAIRHSMLNTTGTVIGSDCLPLFIHGTALTEKARSDADESVELERHSVPVSANKTASSSNSTPTSLGDSAKTTRFELYQFIDDRLTNGSNNLYDEVNQQVERSLITRVLSITEGNQSKAAEILGISRGKLRDRILAYGIQVDRSVSIEE